MFEILAVDPGVNTGIAISNKQSQTLSFNGYEDFAQAMIDFGRTLRTYFDSFRIEKILIERPFFHRQAKHTSLTEALIWEAHKQAKFRNISRAEYSANQIRKVLLGHARRFQGETTKEFDLKIKEAVKQYGFRPRTEHEADAAAIICAYEQLNRCEGQSLPTAIPHNGATYERSRHEEIARKRLGCKDPS